jgi:protein-arginine kinase
MTAIENQPTLGDPKTDIVSNSNAVVNEVVSKDLSKIKLLYRKSR